MPDPWLSNSASRGRVCKDHRLPAALQEVYGKLEEPDGLGGLVRLRKGGPRPQDRVLAAEKEGAWSEALCLYEQALQTSQAWGEA